MNVSYNFFNNQLANDDIDFLAQMQMKKVD